MFPGRTSAGHTVAFIPAHLEINILRRYRGCPRAEYSLAVIHDRPVRGCPLSTVVLKGKIRKIHRFFSNARDSRCPGMAHRTVSPFTCSYIACCCKPIKWWARVHNHQAGFIGFLSNTGMSCQSHVHFPYSAAEPPVHAAPHQL